jgi:hypothetical protein
MTDKGRRKEEKGSRKEKREGTDKGRRKEVGEREYIEEVEKRDDGRTKKTVGGNQPI